VSDLHHDIGGSGPDLVMLHGGAGGIDDLTALRECLAPGRRVIAPDQRGHGQSADTGEMSYAAQAADTAALLDDLGVRAADILGWSDGGIVGLLLARDRPDLVGRLVAISANVADGPQTPATTAESVSGWLAAATSRELPMPEARHVLPNAEADWPATADRILAMWRAGPALELADLGRIGAPVLYVAGDRDLIRTEHTVAMAQATPGAALAIVPDADHSLVHERARDVAAIVEWFLARVPGDEPHPEGR
jgi:pimeloyl-ACP methyl ester carboxylesterase